MAETSILLAPSVNPSATRSHRYLLDASRFNERSDTAGFAICEVGRQHLFAASLRGSWPPGPDLSPTRTLTSSGGSCIVGPVCVEPHASQAKPWQQQKRPSWSCFISLF